MKGWTISILDKSRPLAVNNQQHLLLVLSVPCRMQAPHKLCNSPLFLGFGRGDQIGDLIGIRRLVFVNGFPADKPKRPDIALAVGD